MNGLLKLFVLFQISTALCSDHFHKHVENQMKLGEDLSSPSMKRVYEIYSKATGNRVQIRGRKVDANGVPGNKYARLEVSSISFGGRITIRSVATGRYLCMSKKGRLMGKKKRINSRCRFTERIGENYFDTFTNVRHPEWLLAFQPNGRPKRGPRTSRGQTEVMFLKRPVEEDIVTSTPSPSAVKQKTWSDLEKRFRRQFIAGRDVDIGKPGSSSHSSMMQDDPKLPTITNPPEIQQEIDLRREIALKIDSSESSLDQSNSNATETSMSSTKALRRKTEKSSSLKRKKNKKRKNKKKNKKNKNGSGKLTNNLLTKDFDIHSPSRKRHKQRKTSSEGEIALSLRHESTSESSTVPSLLQVRRTKPPRRSHKKSRRTKTKKTKKSRRRNSSRRRNETQSNT